MKTTHPFRISTGENKNMKCFDICLEMGNFSTKADAEIFAKKLVDFIEKCTDGNGFSVMRAR